MTRHIFVDLMCRYCQVYKTPVLWAEECREETLPHFLLFSLKFGFVKEVGTIKNRLKIVVDGKQIEKSPDATVQKLFMCVVVFFPSKLETFRTHVPFPCS